METSPVPVAAPRVPDNGDYLTDGRRLVLVLRVREMEISCEDALTELPVTVLHQEFRSGRWKVVRRTRGLA